jgi:adenine deaminase
VLGPPAVRELAADAAGQAGRVFLTVPTVTVPDPVHDRWLGSGEEWTRLLDLPGVIGVGEANWTEVIRAHPRVEGLIEGALARGLTVEGHGAGAREVALNAMGGFGVTADHEAITAPDEVDRLRLGLYALLRHGATRQDLPALSALWKEQMLADYSRVALVSDSIEPQNLVAGESLNRVVEMAIESGLPLARAVRLATRNVAERFGLGRWLGGLAPGMLADALLVRRDAAGFRPELVLVGGQRPGPPAVHLYPEEMRHTISLRSLDPALLRPPGRGRWRAIQVVGPLLTQEAETDGSDALLAVAIDRLDRDRAFRGLVLGLGIKGGAVATSCAWDGPCLLAVGDSPDDIVGAIRALDRMQGGAAVVRGGRVVAEWPASLGGVFSLEPADAVVAQLDRVNTALMQMGCPWPNPLLTIDTLTTGVIPHLRLWAEGYVRLRDGAHLGLAWG